MTPNPAIDRSAQQLALLGTRRASRAGARSLRPLGVTKEQEWSSGCSAPLR